MCAVNKKISSISFLRNAKLYDSRDEAIRGLKQAVDSNNQDGMLVLSRYLEGKEVKTLIGVVYNKDESTFITLFGSDETISLNENKSNNLVYEDLYRNCDRFNEIYSICDKLSN